MELFQIGLRTVMVYFLVLLSLRLMGKREVGKLTVFDFVISIMIAEVGMYIVEDPKRSIAEGVIPVVILVSIQIVMSFISLKSRRFRQIMDGRPSVLIRNGKLDRDEMQKQKYNLDDLFNQLRENQVSNIADVEFALLETTGKLSVVKKDDFRRAEDDHPSPLRYEGLPLPLIMDGKVQDENLEKLGQTRFWLKKELQQRGVSDFKDVFICTYDHKGQLFIDKK